MPGASSRRDQGAVNTTKRPVEKNVLLVDYEAKSRAMSPAFLLYDYLQTLRLRANRSHRHWSMSPPLSCSQAFF
jgi:hypothetical protein